MPRCSKFKFCFSVLSGILFRIFSICGWLNLGMWDPWTRRAYRIHLRETKACVRTKISAQMFIAALLPTAPAWKQSQTPFTGESRNRMCYIHTMEYYPSVKRKELLTLATIENSRICQLTYRDRKQICDCLKGTLGWTEKKRIKGHKVAFGGNGYVHYPDCGFSSVGG